jgi:hypothetical protein
MAIVDEAQVRSVSNQSCDIESQRFVQLQGVAGTPEIIIRQEQLVEARIELNGCRNVQEIRPAPGEKAQSETARA